MLDFARNLEIIHFNVGKLFGLMIDTGNAWIDAAVAITAIAVVGILVWALVTFRTKKVESQSNRLVLMNIFLAYASQDKADAESIAFSLRGRGYTVFLDRDDLPLGQTFDQQIERAIGNSEIFIFLISPGSVAEGRFTLTELAFARRKWPNPNDRVLPVMVRKTPLEQIPPYLKAVTILERHGNLAAETSAAVDTMQRGNPARGKAAPAKYRWSIAIGLTLLGILTVSVEINRIAHTNVRLPSTVTVRVPADVQGCVNSGIHVMGGENIRFSATGRATYAPNGLYTDPDGTLFDSAGKQDGRVQRDQNAMLPAVSVGALIGRVRDKLFLVGASSEVMMPESGTLYLCYNDVIGGYAGNTGEYEVTISR
jgi:hypothetical protein